MATQVDNTIGTVELNKVYGIGFLDTNAASYAPATVAAVTTLAGLQALETSGFMNFVKVAAIEPSNAEDGTEEVSGVQFAGVLGEMRAVYTVHSDYAKWKILFDEYNGFSGKQAYLFLMNDKVLYVNSNEDTPNAWGIPLNMVQVKKPPLYKDGTASARFTIQVNVESNLLRNVEDGDLAFPVQLLD